MVSVSSLRLFVSSWGGVKLMTMVFVVESTSTMNF